MFVTPAYAEAVGAGGTQDMLVTMLPFVLIFVIMYFLIIRPQRQQMKKHDEMVKNLRRGDTVVTGGGFIGKVTNATDDNEVTVEIADGVKVKVVRKTIADVRSKGEPAA